jgi:transcriptional regulator with XRE-family HTH domain
MSSSFGAYFKELRTQKGRTLRAFCKANGLDPGNISRLERGKISPPESKENLLKYAKALGLKNGSKEWIEFFDRAAASRRELPVDLLRDEKVLEKLPAVFRTLRAGRAGLGISMGLIGGSDLNLWADSRGCQEDMPKLVRRLVRETVGSPAKAEFRSGEGVQLSGWDGIVETAEGNSYVPKGASFWEVGTGGSPKGKADHDYQKRTSDPLGADPRTATFVFVTPRRWAGKNKWVDEKKRNGDWADVRAYDADDFEQWLELAPSTSAWFARYVGKNSRGARCLEDFWNEFSIATSPELTPAVPTAGREESVKRLHDWLRSGSGILRIRGHSTADVMAFIAAVVAQLQEEDLLRRAARCLIVDEIGAAREIIPTRNQLTLIWNISETDAVPSAIERGHSVIIPEGRAVLPLPREGIDLPRPSYEGLVKALSNCGVKEERARELIRATGGYIQPLRRRIARVPNLARPQWARPENASELLRLLFAGSWDERQEGDQKVLESLAQVPWEAITRITTAHVQGDDAPLRYVGGVWEFVSPFDAWHVLGGYAGLESLQRFVEVAIEVLARESRRLDRPPDQRWMAIEAPFPESHHLRAGLAETIALLGVLGEQGVIGHRAQDAAKRIVAKLLDDRAGWERWYSLAGLLPYLAEAAPDEFLGALDNFLASSETSVGKLFVEEGPLGGESVHTHILWALERLAWLPAYLGHVTAMLGRLAALDPGGKLANRPVSSLAEIFVLWHPNTGATLDERLSALDLLVEREPQVGWDLLLTLLPQFNSVVMPTSTPEWREYPPSSPVTNMEYFRGIQGVIERALRGAGQDASRLAALIQQCGQWPPESRGELLERIRSFCSNNKEVDDRMKVWEALREFVNTHRAFATAKWALPESEVKKLEELLPLVEPTDAFTKSKWLFDDWYPRLPGTGLDVAEGQRQIDQYRMDAARTILAEQGVPGLIALVRVAKVPGFVGQAASAQSPSDAVEEEIIASSLGSSEDSVRIFGMGFVNDRYRRLGDAWAEKVRALIADDSRALTTFYLAIPASRSIWERVASAGLNVEKLYWKEARIYLGKSEELSDVQFALERLYSAGQIKTILDTAWVNAERLAGTDLVQALDSALKALNEKRMELTQDVAYSITQILSALPSKPDLTEDAVARFEWAFLPLLRYGPSPGPLFLHRRLARDPGFFAEVIGLVYRSKSVMGDGSEDVPEPSEEQRARARLGYELLSSWATPVPGAGGDGTLDVSALSDWVRRARKLCDESGHSDIGDIQIGKILAHAPMGSDSAWPHEAVRSVLDQSGSRHMETGFTTGVLNKRGVWTKNIGDGGAQERSLADGFRRDAEKMKIKSPKAARLLRSIADDYDRLGHFADDREDLRT